MMMIMMMMMMMMMTPDLPSAQADHAGEDWDLRERGEDERQRECWFVNFEELIEALLIQHVFF